MNPNRAFTLQQVMIAVTIVLITSAITFALTGPIRRRLDVNTCATHFKSLHASMLIYAADYDGQITTGRSLSDLGFPPAIVKPIPSGSVPAAYVGAVFEWKCPAPKRPFPRGLGDNSWPQYEYFLEQLDKNASAENSFSAVLMRYGGRTPLLYDVHHNDHIAVDIYAPRVPKRLLYIDVNGKFVSKLVTRALLPFDDIGMFELE